MVVKKFQLIYFVSLVIVENFDYNSSFCILKAKKPTEE